jgi:hypothetical protein
MTGAIHQIAIPQRYPAWFCRTAWSFPVGGITDRMQQQAEISVQHTSTVCLGMQRFRRPSDRAGAKARRFRICNFSFQT